MSTTNKTTREEILTIIEVDIPSHITFLQKLIRAKSPNPPGDTREAAQVVADYLKEYSIPYETWSLRDDLPNIVADFNCDFGDDVEETESVVEGKRLVMNGHLDVFPVSPSDKDWQRDPWSGDIDSKYIYGRGVVDMKAGTAASIITYRILHQLFQKQQSLNPSGKSPTTNSLALTVVSDEETGGKFGSKWLLSNENGGGGERWKGDVMINAEPGGLQSIRFGEKGTLRITFTIRTRGAHGAYLNLDEGSIRIATRLITSLLTIQSLKTPDLPEKIRKHMESPEVKKVVDEIMGAGASTILMRPTVNIGVIKGGVKVNMIPDECIFQADIRIPIGMTRDIILTHINTTILPHFPQAVMEIQEAASNAPSLCARDHSMVSIIKRNAVFIGKAKKEGEGEGGLRGDAPPVEIPGIGATDCKFWRYEGVPAYTFGVSPRSMASQNERVEIEEFLDVIRTHVLSAWEFLGGGG